MSDESTIIVRANPYCMSDFTYAILAMLMNCSRFLRLALKRQKIVTILPQTREKHRVIIVSSKSVGNLLAIKSLADNTAFAIRQSRQMNTTY